MSFILEEKIKELEEMVKILNVRVKCFIDVQKDLEIIIEQKNLTIETLNKIIEEDIKVIVNLREKLKKIYLN